MCALGCAQNPVDRKREREREREKNRCRDGVRGGGGYLVKKILRQSSILPLSRDLIRSCSGQSSVGARLGRDHSTSDSLAALARVSL